MQCPYYFQVVSSGDDLWCLLGYWTSRVEIHGEYRVYALLLLV